MNSIATYDQIENTPSRLDGIDGDLETDMRVEACNLIHAACILLKLYVSRRLPFDRSYYLVVLSPSYRRPAYVPYPYQTRHASNLLHV